MPDSVDPNTVVGEILKDPVWDMKPIPCPFHLLLHISPCGGIPCHISPLDTKKYLLQVRNSRGYDLDCFPDPNLVTPQFWNLDLNSEDGMEISNIMKGKLDSTAIGHINKVVSTRVRASLVIFTAKVKDAAASAETFIATLDETDRPDVNPIMECLLKPDYPAPGPVRYVDFIIQPFQVPFLVPEWRAKRAEIEELQGVQFQGRGSQCSTCFIPPTLLRRSASQFQRRVVVLFSVLYPR